MKPKLQVITGQTATGKTKLAIKLAKKGNGEIISADSRQLYRYLDIVTGKDLTNNHFQLVKTTSTGFRIGFYLINGVPVWLYDLVDPNQSFSAYDWALCAKEVLAILRKKQKQAIIAGGSYFYIQSLLYGYKDSGIAPNNKVRQKLEKLSTLKMQQKLQKINPNVYESLNNSDQNNPRRLARWLEKSLTKNSLKPLLGISSQYNIEILGLRYKEKQTLYDKINTRIEQRLKQGALDEVELLLKMGYSRSCPGLQTIGYQQLLAYLYDELTFSEAKAIWFNKEKQYSKRQLTFMKKNKNINWQIL